MAKDLFSSGADDYARYRPTYPAELFEYIFQFVEGRKNAWDCATGNGQAAQALANYFQRVEATDISGAQLKNAIQKEPIHYSISSAEDTPFPDNNFDLITVATAYHWLNWKSFHKEASRVGKPNAVVAVWAYNLVQCEDENINRAVHGFYYDVMYSYWEKERRHVENAYETVEFNFDPLPSKEFFIQRKWTREELLGYVGTWSAVWNYTKQRGTSPIPILEERLLNTWTDGNAKTFQFPLFLKIGRVIK